MTTPTDKASVAAGLIAFAADLERIDAAMGLSGDASNAPRLKLLREAAAALSPAQGDGMRDALVKAQKWIMEWGCYSYDSREAYINLVSEIDAALSSHPVRAVIGHIDNRKTNLTVAFARALSPVPQPGMTDEPTKIRHPRDARIFIERRNYGKWIAHTGISQFVPGEFDTKDDAIAAVDAAIKRASQGER